MYDLDGFYERFKELRDERFDSPRDLDIAVREYDPRGLSVDTSDGWRKGHRPGADRIAVLALVFGVSADYLLGLSAERGAPGVQVRDFPAGRPPAGGFPVKRHRRRKREAEEDA